MACSGQIKRLIISLLFVAGYSFSTNAQINAVQSGSWNDPATWDAGVPTVTDDVVVSGDFVIVVDASGATCNTLRLGAGDELNNGYLVFDASGSLVVTGSITLGDVSGAAGGITLSADAALTCDAIVETDPGVSGIFGLNAGTVTFTGNQVLPENLYQFNNLEIASGITTLSLTSLQIDGDLTIHNTATLNLSSSAANRNTTGGTLTIENGGSLIIGGTGTLPYNFASHVVGGSSTVEYNGTTQIVSLLNSGQPYGNLVISGSGTKQLNGSTGVEGDLAINSGILNLNGFTLNRVSGGGNLTIQAGATLRIMGSGTLPANFATHVLHATSTVEYRGTAAQNIAPLSAGKKYGNLVIINSIKTLAGDVAVAGTLTFGGTPNRLMLNNFSLTLEGAITGSLVSSRNFSGTANSSLFLTGAYNRTIFFDATAPGSTNLVSKLTISHPGNTTSLGSDLVIAGMATFSGGKLAIAGKTLTLKGTVVNSVPAALQGSTTSNLIVNASSSLDISLDQTTDGVTNALNNFTVNSAGKTTTVSGAVSVNGNLSVDAGTLDLDVYNANRVSAGGTLSIGANGILKIGGTNTFPANYTVHTIAAGATIEYGGTNQSIAVLNGQDYPGLTISGTGYKSMLADILVAGTLTFAGGKMVLGNHTLTIGGGINNIVGGGITGSSTSNIIFNSTGYDARLSFDQSSPGSTNRIQDLTYNSGSRVLSLDDELNITGTVNPISGVLESNGNLVLSSSVATTASVAAGSGAGGYITGDVTVERYISSGRRWHVLSVATGGAQSVNEAWQEGAASGSTMGNGYGTWITSNVAGATASGFDYVTPGHSIKTYVPATNVWSGIANTAIPIASEGAYMIFVRGDRSCTSLNNDVSSTILRTRGPLLQGNLSPVPVSAGKFASLSNSYPSAIDFRLLNRSGSINNLFYVWDPRLGGASGLGGFQTFTRDAMGNYKVTPGGGSYGSSGSVCNTIQSGQGFLVKSVGAAGTVQFTEGAKTNSHMLVARPSGATIANLTINLLGNTADDPELIDGVVLEIDQDFNNGIDGSDADKLKNLEESIGIFSNNILLAVEQRASVKAIDTVFLQIEGMKIKDYQFQIKGTNLAGLNKLCSLEDEYTHSSTLLSLSNDNNINFSVTADSGSRAANRFRIVFTPGGVLAANEIQIGATEKNKTVEVRWKVANEAGVLAYEIERAVDGRQFFTIGNIGASPLTGRFYHWLDKHPANGVNYYRIKYTGNNGAVQSSNVVKVEVFNGEPGFIVQPNPVINKQLALQLNNVQPGAYFLQLSNKSGQVFLSQRLLVGEINRTLTIPLPKSITSGAYQLQIIDPAGNKKIIHVLIH